MADQAHFFMADQAWLIRSYILRWSGVHFPAWLIRSKFIMADQAWLIRRDWSGVMTRLISHKKYVLVADQAWLIRCKKKGDWSGVVTDQEWLIRSDWSGVTDQEWLIRSDWSGATDQVWLADQARLIRRDWSGVTDNDVSLANIEKLYLNPSWLTGNDGGNFSDNWSNYSWSIKIVYAWSAMTPDQPWRLISVKWS